MVDTPRVTLESVKTARQALIDQGRKPSQRAVIKLLGGGSFSQVGPLLRELEADAGEVPGSTVTEPLSQAVGEAVELLWRSLGQEADRVVNDARQQFERDLSAEQSVRVQAESTMTRTLETLQATQASLADTEQALAKEKAKLEQVTAALEQERLAHTRTETHLEAAAAQSEERKALRDEATEERDQYRVTLDQLRQESDERLQEYQRTLDQLRAEHAQRVEAMSDTLAQAQRRLTEQQGQLDALRRENTNLSTINEGLSSRIESTRTTLTTAEGRVLEIGAQLAACEKELLMQQNTLAARLADKDQMIETLQRQLSSGKPNKKV